MCNFICLDINSLNPHDFWIACNKGNRFYRTCNHSLGFIAYNRQGKVYHLCICLVWLFFFLNDSTCGGHLSLSQHQASQLTQSLTNHGSNCIGKGNLFTKAVQWFGFRGKKMLQSMPGHEHNSSLKLLKAAVSFPGLHTWPPELPHVIGKEVFPVHPEVGFFAFVSVALQRLSVRCGLVIWQMV